MAKREHWEWGCLAPGLLVSLGSLGWVVMVGAGAIESDIFWVKVAFWLGGLLLMVGACYCWLTRPRGGTVGRRGFEVIRPVESRKNSTGPQKKG